MAKSESEKDIRQKNENLNKTVQEQDVAERNQAYNEYVKQVTPTHNLALKMLNAFVTGGIICCIGQVILPVLIFIHQLQNLAGQEPSFQLLDLPIQWRLLPSNSKRKVRFLGLAAKFLPLRVR